MKRLCFIFVIIFLFTLAVPVLAQQQVGTAWLSRLNLANGDDRANALVINGSGDVYVTGMVAPGPGVAPDYGTVKYDSLGNQLWVRTYNGAGGIPNKLEQGIVSFLSIHRGF